MCRFVTLAVSVSTPVILPLLHSHRTWKGCRVIPEVMTCTKLGLKWGRVAFCQPHCLTQVPLSPVARQDQDGFRKVWVQWMILASLAWPSSEHSHSTLFCCLHGHWIQVVSSIQSRRKVFGCWDRYIPSSMRVWLPSTGLASLWKLSLGVWPQSHADCYWEPQVRFGCQVKTNDGWAALERTWNAPQPEVLSLFKTTHTAQCSLQCIWKHTSLKCIE